MSDSVSRDTQCSAAGQSTDLVKVVEALKGQHESDASDADRLKAELMAYLELNR